MLCVFLTQQPCFEPINKRAIQTAAAPSQMAAPPPPLQTVTCYAVGTASSFVAAQTDLLCTIIPGRACLVVVVVEAGSVRPL